MKAKKAKKHNPKSEVAQRLAINDWRKGACIKFVAGISGKDVLVSAFDMRFQGNGRLIAVFNLSDCYKKRAPLKGIKKNFNKLIKSRKK